ncbi:MAG: hypothetical protein EON91_12520 [Brevundimonas sp.]|uniref:S41 family peptidase n=1 Tax=Brevundimonas sp. TaxID=1871086 RepID=UPI00122AEAC1|nr:S41 family peptidase [Brevundimonas sp.]RZJ16611.1 MAG: hypothetical protein EON91_12520 [Brevundimonas sp.]
MLAILAAALTLTAATPQAADAAASPFDAQARVTEAIAAIRPTAYRRDAVDWAAIETHARADAATARDTIDLLPVYSRLLTALGDHHSFVQVDQSLRDAYKARYGREFDADVPRKPQTSTFIMRRERSARPLALASGKQAELVTAPKVFGGGADARAYADTVFGHVAAASERACGYVVDLRGNVGGNVWPMKAGLSALLGDAYLNSDSYARFENGAFLVNEGQYKGMEAARATNWRSLPGLENTPVAMLIDDGVGSSGEGIAVAFSGRPNTRFFGQTTAGVASSNEGFTLSDDVNLVVTTSMMADREGRIYPDGVPPDTPVAHGEGDPADPDDAVVEAAKAWLTTQPGCAAA